MLRRFSIMTGALCLLGCSDACAATVSVTVTDAKGGPVPNAVVILAPDSAIVMQSHAPEISTIDQRHESFLPLVVVVRKGGEVVFTNNDTTKHQVYSFSPIKRFQFEIDKGQVSKPVQFEKTGVAAIGCNIHDNMVTYVYVADAPFAAVTDTSGHAELRDVPDGAYLASAWHPQLRPGTQSGSTALAVAGGNAKLALTMPVTLLAMRGMSHMHKSDY
jgi:plastocyanin